MEVPDPAVAAQHRMAIFKVVPDASPARRPWRHAKEFATTVNRVRHRPVPPYQRGPSDPRPRHHRLHTTTARPACSAPECPDWYLHRGSQGARTARRPVANLAGQQARSLRHRLRLCMFCGICVEVCPSMRCSGAPSSSTANEDRRPLHDKIASPLDGDRAGLRVRSRLRGRSRKCPPMMAALPRARRRCCAERFF